MRTMTRSIAYTVLIVVLLTLLNIIDVSTVYSVENKPTPNQGEPLIPTAYLTYKALDVEHYKNGILGTLKLYDVDIPDPPFLEYSGIWTHVALYKSTENPDYIVEIGLRRLELNLGPIFIFRQIFITYWDPDIGEKRSEVLASVPLGRIYYVRIARIKNKVWLIGAYSPAENIIVGKARFFAETTITYIAVSQLEFSAPENHINEEPYTVVNHN